MTDCSEIDILESAAVRIRNSINPDSELFTEAKFKYTGEYSLQQCSVAEFVTYKENPEQAMFFDRSTDANNFLDFVSYHRLEFKRNLPTILNSLLGLNVFVSGHTTWTWCNKKYTPGWLLCIEVGNLTFGEKHINHILERFDFNNICESKDERADDDLIDILNKHDIKIDSWAQQATKTGFIFFSDKRHCRQVSKLFSDCVCKISRTNPEESEYYKWSLSVDFPS